MVGITFFCFSSFCFWNVSWWLRNSLKLRRRVGGATYVVRGVAVAWDLGEIDESLLLLLEDEGFSVDPC